MTYRDDSASLEERRSMLRRSLDESRARAAALRNEQAVVHEELASLHRAQSTEQQRPKRALPLANIVVASPCDVPWETMVGDGRVRHCAACKRDVHNLSAMTHDEVDAFLVAANALQGAKPCVSLFQRVDGTILTADCPVGVRRRRLRTLFASGMGVGVAALMAFTALAFLQRDAIPPMASSEHLIPVPVTTVSAPSAPLARVGHVRVDAPANTVIREDGRVIALGPTTFTSAAGTHAYQFTNGASTKQMTVVVTENGITQVTVSFDPPPEHRRLAGKMPVPSHLRGGL